MEEEGFKTSRPEKRLLCELETTHWLQQRAALTHTGRDTHARKKVVWVRKTRCVCVRMFELVTWNRSKRREDGSTDEEKD